MKLTLNYKFLFFLVLLYPVFLGLIFLFNVSPFFITAPYFFLLLFIVSIKVIKSKKITFHKRYIINILLCLGLFLISILNFNGIRYSLPLLFTTYVLFIQLFVLVSKNDISKHEFLRYFKGFFYVYLFLSLLFLFFISFSHMEVGNRFRGFTGSPTTFAAVVVITYLLIDTSFTKFNLKRIALFLIIFWLVYLSKTRLLIVFMFVYPFVIYLINNRKVKKERVYLAFFIVLFFVYPLYGLVVTHFPQLITIRYENSNDVSFGLRHYLYTLVETDFFKGSYSEILLGKGNESSRLFVLNFFDKDLFPHNDFIRIIYDWGIFGGIFFFVLIYRIAKNNITSLMIGLVYLILFYSNMLFNLFIVSIFIITSFIEYPDKNLSDDKKLKATNIIE